MCVRVNYSSPLEMQMTAKAREPPRYVGHFLSRKAAALEERERGIEAKRPADEEEVTVKINFFFAGFL